MELSITFDKKDADNFDILGRAFNEQLDNSCATRSSSREALFKTNNKQNFTLKNNKHIKQTHTYWPNQKLKKEENNPSLDSSIGCTSAWYSRGPSFKSWQGR